MTREAMLKGPSEVIPALVRPLKFGECHGILDEWRGDALEDTLRRHRLCLAWEHWGDVFLEDSGEMFSIDVDGQSVGMIEFHYDGSLEDGTPAVGLLRLARRPSAFLPPEISGIAKPLVLAMVQRSFDTNHLGQVVVREALGPSSEDPELDARPVYESLKFKTIRANPGENSFYMELKGLSAEALIAENQT